MVADNSIRRHERSDSLLLSGPEPNGLLGAEKGLKWLRRASQTGKYDRTVAVNRDSNVIRGRIHYIWPSSWGI